MSRISSMNMLYPPFSYRLSKSLKEARKDGYKIQCFETYRTPLRQNELYNQGRTRPGNIVTRARPYRSWHNYGLAADIVFLVNGGYNWDNEDDYKKVSKYFIKNGLHWSGNEKRSFELVHYQLPVEQSIYEIEKLYRKKGLEAVWLAVNQRYGDKELWGSQNF